MENNQLLSGQLDATTHANLEQLERNLANESDGVKAAFNQSVITKALSEGQSVSKVKGAFEPLLGKQDTNELIKAAFASMANDLGPGMFSALYAHPLVLANPNDMYAFKEAYDDLASDATSFGARQTQYRNTMRLPGLQPSDFTPAVTQPILVMGEGATVRDSPQGTFVTDNRALALLLNRTDSDYRNIALKSFRLSAAGTYTFKPDGATLIGYMLKFSRKTDFKDQIAATVSLSFGSVSFSSTDESCTVVGYYFKQCQNATPKYTVAGSVISVGINATDDGSWSQDLATSNTDPDHEVSIAIESDGTILDYYPIYAEHPWHRQHIMEGLTYGGDADSLYDQEIVRGMNAALRDGRPV